MAYPYEYMGCLDKFNEIRLSSIDILVFYSSLTDENVTKDEYKNAQKMLKASNIPNLQEFINSYNKTDVFLLTDMMKNFRDISLKINKLDLAYYYTPPGFAWDSILKITDAKLDFLTDYNMVLLIERCMRGGITQCSKKNS